MTSFESPVKTIPAAIETVFDTLSDFSNLERLRDKIPEDKVQNFSCDSGRKYSRTHRRKRAVQNHQTRNRRVSGSFLHLGTTATDTRRKHGIETHAPRRVESFHQRHDFKTLARRRQQISRDDRFLAV